MRQPRNERASATKDTRWDRIRKRYTNNGNVSLKSDLVRRFIEVDYIGRQQDSILRGETSLTMQLDPVMVMDIRHQIFQKTSRSLPLTKVGGMRNMKACVDHNLAVDERYIANELKRFRQQLEKQHNRNKLKPRTKQNAEDALLVNNKRIFQSLESTARHFKDFYAAPLEALEENEKLCNPIWEEQKAEKEPENESENEKNRKDWENIERTDFGHEINETEKHEESLNGEALTLNEDGWLNDLSSRSLPEKSVSTDFIELNVVEEKDFDPPEKDKQNPNDKLMFSPLEYETTPRRTPCEVNCKFCTSQARCVRFEDDIEIRQFKREGSFCSSNTSEGIDSVISDLAEEALYELQLEEEAKINAVVAEAATEIKDCEDKTKDCTEKKLHTFNSQYFTVYLSECNATSNLRKSH